MKFYKYNSCNNVLFYINDLACYDNDLQEIKPNSIGEYDAHIPLIVKIGNKVIIKVSLKQHPMVSDHYIMWICLETDKGYYFKKLKPNDEPLATFLLNDNEKIIKAYDYCNLHGLWGERQ